jgi:hypothetical protein
MLCLFLCLVCPHTHTAPRLHPVCLRTHTPLCAPAGDLFDGSLLLQDVGAELWEVERQGGAPKLTVMWGTDLDDFDPHTQVRGCVETRWLHQSTESLLCVGGGGRHKDRQLTDLTGLNPHPVRPLAAKITASGCCGVCCC